MKTFDINHEIVVNAPLEKVFSVWTDFERWPELYPDIYDSVQVERQGNTVLSHEVLKTIAGKQEAKIRTELDPPHKYERQFLDGAMEGSTRTTTFESSSEGTRVITRMNVKLAGMIAMMIGDLAETLFTKNLDKLSKAHARIAEGD